MSSSQILQSSDRCECLARGFDAGRRERAPLTPLRVVPARGPQESTGKSSVLERITMLSLFPRGENIVTRMPIRLHLVHFPNRLAVVDFCAEFEHDVMGEPLDVDEDGFYLRCAVSKRGTPSLLIEVRCVATRLGVGPRAATTTRQGSAA